MGYVLTASVVLAFFALLTGRRLLFICTIAIAIPLSPRIGLGMQLPYGRAIEVRIEDILLGPALFLCILRGHGCVRVARAFIWFTVAWVSGVLSTLLGLLRGGVDASRAVFYVAKELEFVLLVIVAANLLESERDSRVAQRVILLGSAIAGFLALWQFATGSFWGIAGRRASLPFDSGPFPLGGYMLSVLPLALVTVLEEGGSVLELASMLFIVAGLVLSGSRASVLGAAAEFLTILGVSSAWSARKSAKLLVTLLLGASAGLIMLYSTGLVARFSGFMSSAPLGIAVGRSYQARRLEMWPSWLQVALSHLAFGAGISAPAQVSTFTLTVADNYYVLALAERGLVGALLFFGALLVWGVHLSMTAVRMESGHAKAILFAAAATLIGFLVASAATDAFRVIRPAESFWLVQGLAMYSLISTAASSPQRLPSEVERD